MNSSFNENYLSQNLSQRNSDLSSSTSVEILELPLSKDKNKSKKTRLCFYTFLWLLIIFTVVAGLFIIMMTGIYSKAIDLLFKEVKKIRHLPEPWLTLSAYSILIVFQLTFFPAQSQFIILLALIYDSFIKTLAIVILSNFTSALITLVLVRLTMKTCLTNRYRESLLYKVVMLESLKNQYKTNVMIRMMYIPVTFKNVLLSLSNVSVWSYITTSLPCFIFMNSILVGMGISIAKLAEESRDSRKPTKKEKRLRNLMMVIRFGIIISTISILVLVYCFTKRKLKLYQELEREGKLIQYEIEANKKTEQ